MNHQTPATRAATGVVVRTIGAVTIVDVQCPHGRHRHTVGLTEHEGRVWCTHTGRAYTVTVEHTDQP